MIEVRPLRWKDYSKYVDGPRVIRKVQCNPKGREGEMMTKQRLEWYILKVE